MNVGKKIRICVNVDILLVFISKLSKNTHVLYLQVHILFTKLTGQSNEQNIPYKDHNLLHLVYKNG